MALCCAAALLTAAPSCRQDQAKRAPEQARSTLGAHIPPRGFAWGKPGFGGRATTALIATDEGLGFVTATPMLAEAGIGGGCANVVAVGATPRDYDWVAATTNHVASAILARSCKPARDEADEGECTAVAFVRDSAQSTWREVELGCMSYAQGVSLELAPGTDRLYAVLLRFCDAATDYALVTVGLDGALKQDTPLPKQYDYSQVASGPDGAVLLANPATPAVEHATSLVTVSPSGSTQLQAIAAPSGLAAICAKPAVVGGNVLVAAPVRQLADKESGPYCGPAATQVWLARLDAQGHVLNQATWSADPGRFAAGSARTSDGLALAMSLGQGTRGPEIVVLGDSGKVLARHALVPPSAFTGKFWFVLPFHWHEFDHSICAAGGTHAPWGAWFACATPAGWSAASSEIHLAAVPDCAAKP